MVDTETPTVRNAGRPSGSPATPGHPAEELHVANRRLERLEAELIRSSTASYDFAHAAAHDLRAPVRHISTRIGMILARGGDELGDDLTCQLEEVEKSAERMRILIDRLLDYAQLGVQSPAFAAVDLDPLLGEVCEALRDRIREADATVHVDSLPEYQGPQRDPWTRQRMSHLGGRQRNRFRFQTRRATVRAVSPPRGP